MSDTGSGRAPMGPGWSAEPEPVPVSALTGDHPSRAAVLKWLSDQMCRVEEPLIGSFSNSLSEDGARRLLAVMDGVAEHPTNDTLQKLGTFDRKTKVDKHTATHWGYLRGVIEALDAAGQSDAADVLVWQVWHRVNSEARHNEFYRLVLQDKAEVERDYHLLCQEERRLRRLLENGPTSPQECAESGITTDPRLLEALKRAAAHEMTPAELHAQRRSWIIGEMGIEHPELSREQLEALADHAVGPAPLPQDHHDRSGTGSEGREERR